MGLLINQLTSGPHSDGTGSPRRLWTGNSSPFFVGLRKLTNFRAGILSPNHSSDAVTVSVPFPMMVR